MSAANVRTSEINPQAAPESRPSEPSMEDILASIRRIIADDQSRHAIAPPATGRASVPPAAATHPGGTARETAVPPPAAARADPVPSSRPFSPTLRPSLPEPAASKSVAAVPHLNPPPVESVARRPDQAAIDEIAVAGVAAALRAASPVSQPAAPSAESAGPSDPSARAPEVDRAPDVVITPVVSTASKAAAPLIESVEPRPASSTPVAGVMAPPAEAPILPLEAKAPDADPLLSPETGATVETSFNALATSIFVQNAGLNEGLVRDMLRPMLKSWLDDNLPAIVERLVRIEIERVARGGRA